MLRNICSFRLTTIILISILLVACGEKQQTDQLQPTTTSKPSVSTVVASPDHVMDTGDVEAQLFLNASLALDSEAENVKAFALVDSRKRTSLLTINVEEPFPPSLWVTYSTRAHMSFDETPVVLHIKILVDDEIIHTYDILMRDSKTGIIANETSVDVLQGKNVMPETMLVTCVADTHLMHDTDPDTIDPATATAASPKQITELQGTPIRVNFIRARDTQ